MIRKLLYRFRRQVLVWKASRLKRRFDAIPHGSDRLYLDSRRKVDIQLAKLDATEMSKGEAHVVVR